MGEEILRQPEGRVCRRCAVVFIGKFCAPCAKKSKDDWRKANPDYIKQYREKNKEKIKRDVAKYQLENKAKIDEYKKNHRIENLARYTENAAKAYAEDSVARRAAVKAWKKENPSKVKVINQNRRALKKYNGGKLSSGIVQRLMSLQKNRCACCCADLNDSGHHVDHIIPLSKGGAHDDANIQLLCPTCNLSKRDKLPIEFMQSRGFLI